MQTGEQQLQGGNDEMAGMPRLAVLAFVWGTIVPLLASCLLGLSDGATGVQQSADASNIGKFLLDNPSLVQLILVGTACLAPMTAAITHLRKAHAYIAVNVALALTMLIGSVIWLVLALCILFL